MPDESELTLGRYRLVSLLGEGGMGKVYKGYDSALERHVAIKILPSELLADSGRVARFVQEARAASALNHPHVISVYDIGEDRFDGGDNVRYIAMELVDGRTLRELSSAGPLDIRKALKIVTQVAEALTAAHAAGIVHRDLKPDNIMITSAGYAKVLDFGLAKLRIADPGCEDSRTMTRATEPGVVMGTAGYMSPEQVQGRPVDHRSDLFSLGCVLYELVTGRRAFYGNSSVDTLHKIVYSDPEPVRALRPDVPPELVRIVRKALAKDPEERYQTARDLAIDARELLREIDTNPSGSAVTASAAAAPSRRAWPWLAAALAAMVVVAAVAIWFRRSPQSAPAASVESLRVTRVTASGKVICAAISPDGRFVSYVISDQGEQSLWVRQTPAGQSLQLIPPQRVAYWGISFAPDGSIYFGQKGSDAPAGAIYQISPLGGSPRSIIREIDSQPSFSPDGRQMVFLRAAFPDPSHSAVMVANIDGSEPRVLAAVRGPEFFVPIFFAGASWSPDGKLIAAAIVKRDTEESRIVGIDSASGSMRTIAAGDWRQVAQVAWMPDQRGVVAIITPRDETVGQVYYVSYPEGKASRITNDLFDYRIVSLTADGNSLLTVASEATSDLWIHFHGAAPKRLTHARLEGSQGIDVAADGRIVFTSLESGKLDLWIMNADGSGRRLVTRDEHENRQPRFTPDGKTIVYVSNTSKGAELCRINSDGSGRQVLGKTFRLATPDVSPDGKWIVVEIPPVAMGVEATALIRMPIDGGAPQLLTNIPGTVARYSPDGSQIAFYDFRAGNYSLSIIPATGGEPVRRIVFAPPFHSARIGWAPDAKALIVNTAPSDRANLWRVPLDGSAPSRLTEFDERLLFAFAPLPDEKGWVLSRGELSRDALMITGFAP